jgi:hypothetical protein
MTKPAPTYTPAIDISRLREQGSARFGKTVDWDMRGTPITDCSVLLHGAYGPAVMRLVNLAMQRETAPVDKARLAELAAEAFAQAVDIDFGGNVMTNYGIVLEDSYGFGPVTLGLVNLAITERHLVAQVN